MRGAKAQIQRHEANDQAHREEHRPDHAEKQHRFAREADLEPDGHQIEHAHRNASDPEFRATRAPRMHRHRPLGEAEPLRGGDHHHEAMPIGSHRHDVHDLAAIRLHGVQVLHPHAEQPTAQRVVNPRNEALVILPLLGAGDDVGLAFQDRPDQPRNIGRQVLQVGGIVDQHPAPREVGARLQGVGNPALRPMRHHAHERVLDDELLQQPRGAVVAAVVDDHELDRVRQRQHRLAGQPHELGEVLRFVFCRNQHAHIGRCGIGREAHRRFRIRAGRMPSWSRYLATVRRAILTPLRSNSSTIC